MTYSEEQYIAILAVCKSYMDDYDNACESLKAQQREINALQEENTNLTVENEVLRSEKENLMRTLEEGREEIESARKETARELLLRLYNWASVIFDCDDIIIAEQNFKDTIKALAEEEYNV